MKRKKVKRNFAERAYRSTPVDHQSTRGSIEKMLEELGIENVRFTKEGSDHCVEFLVKLQHNESPRKVKINLPYTEDIDRKDNPEQRINVLHRVLIHHLKARFVAVANGLREFEEEFLADLVVINNGKEIRIGELIAPQYKEQLKGRAIPVLKLIGQ